jgi:hypothetical protein
MGEPLLDLKSVTDTAQHVRIDGHLYPLRQADALSIRHQLRLSRDMQRLGRLLMLEERTEEEDAEVTQLIGDTCRIVLLGADAAIARLTDIQRLSILEAFSTPRLEHRRAVVAKTNRPARRSTGANGSRASNGSTAARRKTGSTTSR